MAAAGLDASVGVATCGEAAGFSAGVAAGPRTARISTKVRSAVRRPEIFQPCNIPYPPRVGAACRGIGTPGLEVQSRGCDQRVPDRALAMGAARLPEVAHTRGAPRRPYTPAEQSCQ